MDISTTTILSYLVLYSVIWLCFYLLTGRLRSGRRSIRIPPGPSQIPLIGNLHQIGQKPHRSFAQLSKIYGPLMSVKLGTKLTVLVSSAGVAREVLQTHDRICSSRPIPMAARVLDHHKFSVGWLPASAQWRNIRKMCQEQIFSTQRLDRSQGLRQEKLKELGDYLRDCSRIGKVVDIGEAAFTTSLNLLSRTLFSIDFASYDTDSSQELKEIMWAVMKSFGTSNFSDFFPVLQLIGLQGIAREARLSFGKMFDIFDRIIKKRKLDRGLPSSETKKKDLLEALLDENIKNESEFSINVLKHLLFDLLVAGVDTTAATVEWVMAELLRNPEKLEITREELKRVIGKKENVQESDISRLPYLQAIVKETFRLHPPVPLLMPHKADEDVEINGYTVPKDTQILINAWAIGRDEETWTQPEMFMPERFLESEIDVKGMHFELIPFGAGRRICSGLPLAYRMTHLLVASFIHNIDWKLEGGIKPEDLDMDEKVGLTVEKALPLKASPTLL
ncbi:OLC1v1038987C1 [Oldenlandia corymbosa var. corymbosa]|uniref:OLC1v1038987C1 n=1 Tax=Oldenlandia corymbosa var. corymbosa TaxID=529605 RepID=A0AAV1D3P8_OLDCO|nr:OLC1v1038987C1 [Oldenlandia corymbosa var. corymbosa]